MWSTQDFLGKKKSPPSPSSLAPSPSAPCVWETAAEIEWKCRYVDAMMCACVRACVVIRAWRLEGGREPFLSVCHCVLWDAPAIMILCSVFCRCCCHCMWSWILGEFQPGAPGHHVAAVGGLKAWPVHQTQSVSREHLSLSTCTALGMCWRSLSVNRWSSSSKKPGNRT